MNIEPGDAQLAATGRVCEELKQHLAKPSGVNLQSWCHANPTQWQPGFECIIEQETGQGLRMSLFTSKISFMHLFGKVVVSTTFGNVMSTCFQLAYTETA